jgi:pilus assembly protein CpaE
MTEKIRVLIVDDIPETRENVRKLLQFESDLEVIGHAGTGGDAIRLAQEHRPDIILMDINMPDADGITASQQITKNVPGAQVIIMSVQSEADYLRRAMLAGARDFLMKPFSGDELVEAVRRVHETRPEIHTAVVPQTSPTVKGQVKESVRDGKILAVFSPKGGIGCTTIAVNVAVAIASSGNNTLLIDGSLQFGDVGIMLNLRSPASIVDLIENVSDLDQDLLSSVLQEHTSGLKVLLAPPRPEMAELVSAEDIKTLLETLRTAFNYIVLDTSSSLTEVNLAMLDIADKIILLARQDLPSIKNVSRFFDLSEGLEYEKKKVVLVINHASKKQSISVKNIEDTLKWPASAVIPEDLSAYTAADQGKPLVFPAAQKRPISRAIIRLSNNLLSDFGKESKLSSVEESNGSSGLSRLFNR